MTGDRPLPQTVSHGSLRSVPWQIWVVTAVLAVVGGCELLLVPQQPGMIVAVAIKCLVVVGLLKAWRWIFVLCLVYEAFAVPAGLGTTPAIAFLNLTLMILVASSIRYFFPPLRFDTVRSETVSR